MKRKARNLVLLIVVPLVLLAIIDSLARVAVERVSARELERVDAIDAGAVETSVDSFPFLGRLLLSGETSFSIALDDVTERGVRVDRIEFDVDGLVFNRAQALDRKVRIDEIDRVRASVIIDEDTISAATGVDVDLEPGSATAAGVQVGVAVEGRQVRATIPGVGSGSVDIPSTDYVPCEPELAIETDRIVGSCTTETLPPVVNEALGRVNP